MGSGISKNNNNKISLCMYQGKYYIYKNVHKDIFYIYESLINMKRNNHYKVVNKKNLVNFMIISENVLPLYIN